MSCFFRVVPLHWLLIVLALACLPPWGGRGGLSQFFTTVESAVMSFEKLPGLYDVSVIGLLLIVVAIMFQIAFWAEKDR